MIRKFLLIFFLILIGINFLIPHFSLAQYGLEEGQKIQGISQSEPEIFAGNIIKAVLLVIGIILIILIIYGGITYATAMGNEDKLKTAKSILVYAIIGTIIIALAYAITIFILGALTPKTQTAGKTPADQGQAQQSFNCTCKKGNKITAVSAEDCKNKCVEKGDTIDSFVTASKETIKYDEHGTPYTYKPPTPEETCKKENEKCLFSPEANTEDGTLEIQGLTPVNNCCTGLDCDLGTQTCLKKCAGNGESYVLESLVKREFIPCCTGLTRDIENQICEKARL